MGQRKGFQQDSDVLLGGDGLRSEQDKLLGVEHDLQRAQDVFGTAVGGCGLHLAHEAFADDVVSAPGEELWSEERHHGVGKTAKIRLHRRDISLTRQELLTQFERGPHERHEG